MAARFFVDENALPVGRALAAVRRGDVVHPGHPLLPEVPLGSEDVAWLPLVARGGMVVLTWDKRIRYRRAEIDAALEAGGRVLFFTGGNQRMWDRLDTVVRAWPVIDRLPDVPGPWAKSYSSGRLRDLTATPE